MNLRDWVIIQNTGNAGLDGREGLFAGSSGLSIEKDGTQTRLLIVLLFEPLPDQLAVLAPENCVQLTATSVPIE